MEDFTSYSSLAETSYETQSYEEKEQFFHSVYISGKNREGNDGIIQKTGMLQVKDITYNKDKVHMIITHTKQVLVKSRNENKRNILECFSYQSGDKPYRGMSGNICGTNSAERAASSFCDTCKAHIIAAGIYCDENGKPITDDEGKPIFIFVRGSGMKYSGVASYLNELGNLKDLTPIFTPVTEQSTQFEKIAVNNKRFVTKVTVGEAESKYGTSRVFKLEAGVEVPKDTVLKMLEISKKTMDKFSDKFDWSKNKDNKPNKVVSTDQQFSTENKISTSNETKQNVNNMKTESSVPTPQSEQDFDFSGIDF